ncbi:related to Cell division control protein 15 [Sporisorium reilianum SRZ2]|uniref:Related to Cell division control protein 15 n=1 Tax=Sporisorium reilianum (strain SRZ2) TaxID=999809 RepID=E6ZJR1_SPORE|nr:related to Cell division control protein 15 [Sporisorium reilianum SRZ2]
MPSDRRSTSAGSNHSSRSRADRASGSMGSDGGEAGRRIAAEDEYIRQQLAETTSFCNAFWGLNDAGFEAISARMKASQRTLDELKSLYKERADIEAEYAKRLAKLSRQALGHSETGALKAAFDVVKAELDTTSRTHADLANMIKKDLGGAVTDFANKSWNTRKAAQANIEKLHKHKQTQESYVNKSREKYEQDCIKINGYTAQSSLVQGKDLDKVAYKLDKAQATVSQNDRDYQNFVRALRDTTVKWNAEWKAYLDQCQDQEEERIDFTKSNLWNFANAVSAVCVADDESCERIRVSLENVDTPRDVQFFIEYCGTGSLIPAPPEYINYAKGQAPPARPTYHSARFQRNTTRPTQLPIPQQPQQQQQPLASPQQPQEPPQPVAPQPPQPLHPVSQQPPAAAPRNGVYHDKPVPAQPYAQYDAEPQQPVAAPALPPSHAAPAPSANPVSPSTPTKPFQSPQRSMSTKKFLARTSSLSHPNSPKQSASSRPAPVAPLGGGSAAANGQPAASAASAVDDDDPIAKALASLRMRPGGKSPGPARRESLSAEQQQPPAPFAQPGQIVHNMPLQHRAHSPSPSMASNLPPRARSPSAAFMQAPARAASPLPVEEVVGQYGQSFPGERKSLSRQNSVASRAGVQAAEAPKSPNKQQHEQGFAGVGARGRSPSPQPWTRPTQQQQQLQHQQQQQAAQSPRVPAPSSDQPKTGTLSRRQSQIPARSTTPLGIALDATGSVTHDQMAVDYMRRAGSVPPQQPPPPPPQQQARPPSVVHANYAQQQKAHHQAHPSVSSQYSQAPPHQLQSPYSYQGAPPAADARQPYQGHAAQPSVYSTVGQSIPQMAPAVAPQQQPYGAHAPAGYEQAPQAPAASQSVPAHMAQYAGSPAPMQNAYAAPQQQQQPAPAAAQPVGPGGYYAPPMQQQGSQYARAQETPASAYMHEYLQQQQQPQPNGVGHAQQPSTASVAPSHYQQPPPQQQAQWARATSPAPAPAPAAAAPPPAAAGPSQPQGHAPTGQYSDAGQPILFYVKALYDYQATNPDEFSFTTGDIIAVTHTEADGWWQGELLDEARRKQGANTFPSNFVALLM